MNGEQGTGNREPLDAGVAARLAGMPYYIEPSLTVPWIVLPEGRNPVRFGLWVRSKAELVDLIEQLNHLEAVATAEEVDAFLRKHTGGQPS